jgi:hypothetical protein
MSDDHYYDDDVETAMEKVKRLFRENKVVTAGASPPPPAPTLSPFRILPLSPLFFFVATSPIQIPL